MPRLFQIVKRVVQAGFATTTTTVSLKPAPQLSTVVTGGATVPIAPAVAITQAPAQALIKVAPAPGLTPLVSGSASAPVAPAPQVQTVLALQPVAVTEALTETVYVNLAGTYGASTATNSTVSGNAWTTTANATGTHNGTISGHNGAIAAQDASLSFTFPTFPNKSGLTVTAAKLRFYASQGGTALNNATLEFARGTAANPAATFIVGFTTNVDFTTTPYEVDLFAAGFTTFASLENFGCRIRGAINAAGATVTQAVDAVELVVTATA